VAFAFSLLSKSPKEEKFDTPQNSTLRSLAASFYQRIVCFDTMYDCMNYDGYLSMNILGQIGFLVQWIERHAKLLAMAVMFFYLGSSVRLYYIRMERRMSWA